MHFAAQNQTLQQLATHRPNIFFWKYQPNLTWTFKHKEQFNRPQRPVNPGPLGWANRLHRFLFRKYVMRTVHRNTMQCECDAWWDCALLNQLIQCMIRLCIPAPLVKARRWGRAKNSSNLQHFVRVKDCVYYLPWVIAMAFFDSHTTSTAKRASRPLTPWTPVSVNRSRWIFDINTFTISTPL